MLLVSFVAISITIYYLVPVVESGINYLWKSIEELMKLITS